jgi:hypothetical protein
MQRKHLVICLLVVSLGQLLLLVTYGWLLASKLPPRESREGPNFSALEMYMYFSASGAVPIATMTFLGALKCINPNLITFRLNDIRAFTKLALILTLGSPMPPLALFALYHFNTWKDHHT